MKVGYMEIDKEDFSEIEKINIISALSNEETIYFTVYTENRVFTFRMPRKDFGGTSKSLEKKLEENSRLNQFGK